MFFGKRQSDKKKKVNNVKKRLRFAGVLLIMDTLDFFKTSI